MEYLGSLSYYQIGVEDGDIATGLVIGERGSILSLFLLIIHYYIF